MVKQHQLRGAKGSRQKSKRLGRGDGSGRGTYAGKGVKGQNARSGGKRRPGFEGGQIPFILRMPTIPGFTNIFATRYAVVNLDNLAGRFDGDAVITPEAMASAGILRNLNLPVKVLGRGTISKPLTVEAHRFSSKARESLIEAGGEVREVSFVRSRKGNK